MAVYRSDQAQVTFMTEPAAGGYVEMAPQSAVPAASAAATTISTAHPAGSRTLTVGANTNFNVGDAIQLGHGTATIENEIRQIEHISGTTFYLSAPTAFYHPASTAVKQIEPTITGNLRSATDIYIDLVPGAYETVDVPDPEMAIEGRWFLGTASKRAFYAAYSGQQTYAGSLGGFALLNGRALRYPIGKVTSTTTFLNVTATNSTVDYGAVINGATKKGDIFVTIDGALVNNSATDVAANEILLFTGQTTVPGNTTISNATTEIRRHVGSASQTALKLDYPLQFDHADDEIILRVMTTDGGSGTTSAISTANPVIAYTHAISETVDLDSVSWNVHMLPSDENRLKAFDRRYYGGKIGSMTLSGEEGGMVTASWDSVNFLGMVHNQQAYTQSGLKTALINMSGNLNATATAITFDADGGLAVGDVIKIDDELMTISALTSTVATVSRGSYGTTGATHLDNATISVVIPTPFYAAFQSIVDSDVTPNFPSNEPYYFSQGEVSMFGQTIARIRSFSLSITNNEEPRYYITKQMGRRRGPTEIREQRREYSLAVTLALPDAAASNAAQQTLFQEMLLEGNYGNLQNFTRTGKKGFNVSITFTKGDIAGSTLDDEIVITIPADYTAGTESTGAATGGNQQGAFIRTAPHNITEDNPFQVEADILFRNLSIVVQDTEHYYP